MPEPSAARTPRILWISPTLDSDFGGPTSTTVNALIAEARGGIRSRLVTTRGPSAADLSANSIETLRSRGVPVVQFSRLGATGRSAAWGLSPSMLAWMVKGFRSHDLVHLQYVWCASTLWGCLLGAVTGVPVVLSPHESLTRYDIEVNSKSRGKRLAKRLLRRLLLRGVDSLVLMSDLEERETESFGRQSVVIAHAVAEREAVPRPYGTIRITRPLRIGFLGRNVPKKGIDRILEAMATERESDWQLLVAGPPGSSSFVRRHKRLAEELGVGGQVAWLGYVSTPESLFDRCDVIVMPSEYEGFGMAAAEAMASGVPVIVPWESGVAELVSEFRAGLILEEPTSRALRATLREFDSSRAEWEGFSRNGTRAANERLSFASYSSAIADLYGSLLAGVGSPDAAASADIARTRAAGR